jgi:hypothetical protein
LLNWLKNAMNIASRPYGQSAWAGKTAGVLGASVGAVGPALLFPFPMVKKRKPDSPHPVRITKSIIGTNKAIR